MSATNRGAERNRDDFYPTPKWCVDRLVEEVALPGSRWLEPCIGDGAIVRALPNEAWSGCDIREVTNDTVPVFQADAATLSDDFLRRFDTIVTNPPFLLFFPIMRRLVEGAPRADVALLGRLNLLGSGVRDGRSAWLRSHMPDVYVLPNRPSFTTDGGTDATEYAWFHWAGYRHRNGAGSVKILAETPKGERNP